MTNYIKRLIYIDDGEQEKINPLFYPFMFGTLVYGLGFVLFGDASGVTSSSLFRALNDLHNWLPLVWGIASLTAGVLSFYCVLTRKTKFVSAFTAMLGVLVWLFAAFVYLLSGAWMLFFTITIPYGSFWVYWYIRLKWYQRLKSVGSISDPR